MKASFGVFAVAHLLLGGCFGKYEVGTEPAEGGSSGAGSSAGMATESGGSAAVAAASGGATSASGGAMSASGGALTTGGMNSGTGGDAGAGDGKCFPAPPLVGKGFAEGDVVRQRLELFVLGEIVSVGGLPDLPFYATRPWAGATALELLETTEVPFVATRFLARWHPPGNVEPTPDSLVWASAWSPLVSAPSWDFRNLVTPANDSGPGRAGILTDEVVLKTEWNASKRGTWLLENLFCFAVPREPPNTKDALPSRPPGVTRRQYLENLGLESPPCAGCHSIVDPPGFAFEHFDETGTYGTTDNGASVDTSGAFTTQKGSRFTFMSVVDLAPQLMESCEVAHCIAERMTRDALISAGLSERVPDAAEINHIANEFHDSQFSTRTLIGEVAKTPSLLR